MLSSTGPETPLFECWTVLAALGASTARIRVGSLATANTFRNPGLLAKMAVTLDHVTGGRAILGLGQGWYEPEHTAYGFSYGSQRERSEKLLESAEIIRSLLDRPRTTFAGEHFHFADAPAEPKPVQPRLPLLIAGDGERWTLRAAARFADIWNGIPGTPETVAKKLAVLRRHCAEVGRDPSEVLPTLAVGVVVRRDEAAIRARLEEIAEHNRGRDRFVEQGILGTVEQVARVLAAFWRVGVRGFVVRGPAPYDRETFERLAREVRPRLAELVS